MATYKNQSLASLERERMRAVARGGASTPADPARPSVNLVEAVWLLTLENRVLLAIIRDKKPPIGCGVGADERPGAAEPRPDLAKLEAAGFITMKSLGRRKSPSVATRKIVVEIDPCSDHDQSRVA